MPQIELYSPVGEEVPRATGIAPFPEPGGSKIAFLFNGHVSVLPFWKNLEEEIKLASNHLTQTPSSSSTPSLLLGLPPSRTCRM